MQPQPMTSTEKTQPVSVVLARLIRDNDMDVAREARTATHGGYNKEMLDLTGRAERLFIRERELLLSLNQLDDYDEQEMELDNGRCSPRKLDSTTTMPAAK